jgi:4'-phosphopantetheinyl transferase
MSQSAKGFLGINSTSFLSPPIDFELADNGIDFWRAALDLPERIIKDYKQTLSIDERERADKYFFDQDRNRFIVRRGILRTILSNYLNAEPSLVKFCYSETGKPAVAASSKADSMRFSLSHSEGIALYAFTRDTKIGVDIEYIRAISEMDQIADHFFSAKENAVFRDLPESLKKDAFMICWTRKEAFIKAIGDGLSYTLDKFEVSLRPGEPSRLRYIEGNSPAVSVWFIQDLMAGSKFAAAYAVEGKAHQVHCYQWPD